MALNIVEVTQNNCGCTANHACVSLKPPLGAPRSAGRYHIGMLWRGNGHGRFNTCSSMDTHIAFFAFISKDSYRRIDYGVPKQRLIFLRNFEIGLLKMNSKCLASKITMP